MNPCKLLQRQQAQRGRAHLPDMPTEMMGLRLSKAPLNSLYVVEFVYFEDTGPLQPRGQQRVGAATRQRSVCRDLAYPETLGKLSETARSSALDQMANYKTDCLCMYTQFTWRLTTRSCFSNDHQYNLP